MCSIYIESKHRHKLKEKRREIVPRQSNKVIFWGCPMLENLKWKSTHYHPRCCKENTRTRSMYQRPIKITNCNKYYWLVMAWKGVLILYDSDQLYHWFLLLIIELYFTFFLLEVSSKNHFFTLIWTSIWLCITDTLCCYESKRRDNTGVSEQKVQT